MKAPTRRRRRRRGRKKKDAFVGGVFPYPIKVTKI
jgi:hypothetical protein